MIPLRGTIQIENRRHKRFLSCIIPLFLVWLLVLPVALLLLPIFVVVCLFVRVNPFLVISAFWRIATSLKGTSVEVDDGQHLVLVHIP
jgi:hypothetical protein